MPCLGELFLVPIAAQCVLSVRGNLRSNTGQYCFENFVFVSLVLCASCVCIFVFLFVLVIYNYSENSS